MYGVSEVRVIIAPEAEEYAKSREVYNSLVRIKKIIWETIPSLKGLRIDLEDDLDEGGYPVIRFTITTSEPVKQVLKLYDHLLDVFCGEIPPAHQIYFTFSCQFAR